MLEMFVSSLASNDLCLSLVISHLFLLILNSILLLCNLYAIYKPYTPLELHPSTTIRINGGCTKRYKNSPNYGLIINSFKHISIEFSLNRNNTSFITLYKSFPCQVSITSFTLENGFFPKSIAFSTIKNLLTSISFSNLF